MSHRLSLTHDGFYTCSNPSCSIAVDAPVVDLVVDTQCPAWDCKGGGPDASHVYVTGDGGAECTYCGEEIAGPSDGGVEIDEVLIVAGDLPDDGWISAVQLGTVRVRRQRGPAVVETEFGPLSLSEDFDGFIAVDSSGHPFPVTHATYKKRYASVTPGVVPGNTPSNPVATSGSHPADGKA